MIDRSLQYGPLRLHVFSEQPLTLPLPMEHGSFSMWVPPMELDLYLRSPEMPFREDSRRELPGALRDFYSVLDELHIAHLAPERHCNAWWERDGVIYGSFPYVSDRFRLAVFPEIGRIEIWGTEINLNRVILDLLSCFAVTPPLHGAAVQRAGKAFLLLADSGGGKTRVVNALLDREYVYIADEEVFWQEDRVLCCGRIIQGKNGFPNRVPLRCLEGDEGCTVHRSLLLNALSGSRAPVLMPFIARQSFWAQSLIPRCGRSELRERLEAADIRYRKILRNSISVSVNHSSFDNSLNEIDALLRQNE